MLNNYHTLLHLKREFEKLIGMKVIEIFSQEKDTVTFNFFDGIKQYYLHFSAQNNFSHIYLDTNFNRARKNSINLMQELLGDYLQNVSIENNDRVIEFQFIDYSIFFHLFSGSSANLFLCDKEKNIIFKFNKISAKEEKKYEYKKTELLNLFNIPANEQIIKALSKSDLLLTKYYAEEIIIRCNLDQNLKLCELTNQQLAELYERSEKLVFELQNSKEYYIIQTENEPIFSLIPLSNYNNIIYKSDNISYLIKKCKYSKLKHINEIKLRKEISEALQKYHDKCTRKLEEYKIKLENTKLANTYKIIGDLLISQNNLKIKGITLINLENYDGEKLFVKLDPKLSIIENAQKYYEKSKKIIKEIDLIKSKIDKLQKSLDVHQYLSTKLHSIKNYKEFKTLFNELVNYKIIPQTTNKSKELDKFKFKKFDLTSGYKLLVGKNAENNDLLTFKFARPHDLWLHTKGASGSHAIIPLNKKQIVPAEIIRKAAEITAYYSSLRNANYVPVVYTEKKYIRKPKGAKPGAVIVTRGKTIFVEPNINKIMSNNNLIENV